MGQAFLRGGSPHGPGPHPVQCIPQSCYPKSNTPKHYLSDLDIFMQTVADKSPEDIDVRDIDRFIDSQLAAELKPATINRRLASLHTFFEFLAFEDPEREWPNPVVNRRHCLKTGKRLPRDLPDADVARLFSAMTDPRDRAVFGLMVGAGLRVGEVASLRLDGIQAPAAVDQLCALRVRGKGDRERVVWLTRSLQAVLQAWLDERRADGHDYVFHNQHGRPISVSGIQYCLKQYGQATGVALSCHHLRHTFARRLVEGGLPVDSLAKLLGHSRLRSTQRYFLLIEVLVSSRREREAEARRSEEHKERLIRQMGSRIYDKAHRAV